MKFNQIYVVYVGTPPPDETWHASLSGVIPSGLPQGTRDAFPLSGLPQGEAHSARKHHIRMTDISYPDMSGSLTKVSKSYYIIPTVCHNPHSATYKAKGQEWWQVTSHDLWQPRRLPRSLTAALRVIMALPPPRGIMTSQKVSPPLKNEAKLLSLYIWTFTQGGR